MQGQAHLILDSTTKEALPAWSSVSQEAKVCLPVLELLSAYDWSNWRRPETWGKWNVRFFAKTGINLIQAVLMMSNLSAAIDIIIMQMHPFISALTTGRMHELPRKHPWLHEKFTSGGFYGMGRSVCLWEGLATDLIMERDMMKSLKEWRNMTHGLEITESLWTTSVNSMHRCVSVHAANISGRQRTWRRRRETISLLK